MALLTTLAEWSPPAEGRTQSARAGCWCRARSSRQSRWAGRRRARRGTRCPRRGWSGWPCRRASSGAAWCWRWCPGRAPRSSCSTFRCAPPAPSWCPTRRRCSSPAGQFRSRCCPSRASAGGGAGPPCTRRTSSCRTSWSTSAGRTGSTRRRSRRRTCRWQAASTPLYHCGGWLLLSLLSPHNYHRHCKKRGHGLGMRQQSKEEAHEKGGRPLSYGCISTYLL